MTPPPLRNRIEIMHGVNMDALGRRDPRHYPSLTLDELERKISGFAGELGLEPSFFQTNSERAFVERLHGLEKVADGIVINPGAWTHYAWSIHDALEIARLPAVEVHLSAVDTREDWRKVSVVRDLCLATVSGEGVEGYREALVRLSAEIRDQ
ncbi:MAG: type II 3-dehydroquinate dehydratase [Solirubrobacteraceae bacterium]